MLNYYYSDQISDFLKKSTEEVIGSITIGNTFDVKATENNSWLQQIPILQDAFEGLEGILFFEFSIPRMGKRIDVLAIIQGVVFVLEFKVGESKFQSYHLEQVWDYALDLKNFHEPSHDLLMVPILIASESKSSHLNLETTIHDDRLLKPIKTGFQDLKKAIHIVLDSNLSTNVVIGDSFAKGRYAPTPTVIEAAIHLFQNHTVDAITRNDADATNLSVTTDFVSDIIANAKQNQKKSICFVTGVPGAGKTLVGLKIATTHLEKENGDSSVYLSGNGPLVAILQEALTRDKVVREKMAGNKITKKEAKQSVKSFIQAVHHYRDEYLVKEHEPYDHVAIFDEAQRAWNIAQTANFMKQKKGRPNFNQSEPEFLISCLDRHKDWAVVICLVGGGQEINTGEGGISEWLEAIDRRFNHWDIYVSPNLNESEFSAAHALEKLESKAHVFYQKDLHLSISLRSFRAENLSQFVKSLLDRNIEEAQRQLSKFQHRYPVVLTRDLEKGKAWLKQQARGSERYGILVSSQAQRLRPLAIDVRAPMDPVNWFLNGKDDVRSSYFMEDVATEFKVQGLEIDWACITWDGDLRFVNNQWKTFSFKGNKWQRVEKAERQLYMINAYRVLLTRARKGMIVVVPMGNEDDPTRPPSFYDGAYNYLKSLGLQVI